MISQSVITMQFVFEMHEDVGAVLYWIIPMVIIRHTAKLYEGKKTCFTSLLPLVFKSSTWLRSAASWLQNRWLGSSSLLVCWSDKEMLRQSRITFPCKFKCSFENVMSILTFIHGASPVRFRVCFCVRFDFDFFRVVLACFVGSEKMRKWRRIDHHSVGFRR